MPRLALVMAATVALSSASWAPMSDEELITSSPVIVLGTLVQSDVAGSFGAIRVTESLKGDRDEPLILGGRPAIVSSDTLFYRVGQTGLWFLRPISDSDNSLHLADHPRRFEANTAEIARWRALFANGASSKDF